MQKPLIGSKIAILVGNGFDEVQMTDCQRAFIAAGATLKLISTAPNLVNGWQGNSWGHYYPVDQHVGETLAADFDMLFLPGGERSLAKLLETAHTKRIIRGFRDAGKPVAAIGSGIELLIAAERVTGLEISANPTSEDKARAAGATIATAPMSIDHNVLTAADSVDLKAFIAEMLALFSGSEDMQSAA